MNSKATQFKISATSEANVLDLAKTVFSQKHAQKQLSSHNQDARLCEWPRKWKTKWAKRHLWHQHKLQSHASSSCNSAFRSCVVEYHAVHLRQNLWLMRYTYNIITSRYSLLLQKSRRHVGCNSSCLGKPTKIQRAHIGRQELEL